MPPSTAAWFEFVYEDDEYEASKAEPFLHQIDPDILPVKPVEVIIRAGDVLFIPKDWIHEVHTIESSVMVTWNFLWGFNDLVGSILKHLVYGWGGAAIFRP